MMAKSKDSRPVQTVPRARAVFSRKEVFSDFVTSFGPPGLKATRNDTHRSNWIHPRGK